MTTPKERKQLILDALHQVEVTRASDPLHKKFESGLGKNKICPCEHCKTFAALSKELTEVNVVLRKERKQRKYERLKKEMEGMNKGEQAHYLQLKRIDQDDIEEYFGISGWTIRENTPDIILKEREEDDKIMYDAWLRGISPCGSEAENLPLNQVRDKSAVQHRFKVYERKYGRRKGVNRKLVEEGYKQGLTPAEIAEKHGIEYQTVYYHYKRVEDDANAEVKLVEKQKEPTEPLSAPTKPTPTESNDALSLVLEHFGDVIQQAANDKIADYAKENDYESVRSVADLMVQLQK